MNHVGSERFRYNLAESMSCSSGFIKHVDFLPIPEAFLEGVPEAVSHFPALEGN
jgi:hypothetical protein